MQNSVAKKFFAVGVAVSTVLLGLAPLAAQAAAHAEGTNIAKGGEVGMIIGGQYRPYTSAGAFLTYGFNSWAGVVTANADDLALPTGAFIAPQDGKIFCATETKGSDVKGECSLVTAGTKAAFTSAAVFTGLGFSFARAQYGDSSFLSKTSNVDNVVAAHRAGVLVNNNGTVLLVGATGLLGIPDPATFNSWGYSFADVVTANAADKAMSQTGVMATRLPGQLSPTALVNPPPCTSNCGPPVVNGSVSASLASDTPAASTIVASSSAVTLAKFAFSGSGTVTQLQLKRIGVSADTVLSNVYLYDGGLRLTDAASVGGSSVITFNSPTGLFTVSGNKTISVVAEIAGAATSGQTVGVQLISVAVAGGTPTTASISGNLHTISSVSDLASVDFGTVTPSAGAFDPAVDVQIFSSSVAIGTRDVTLSRLALRQIGSVLYSDIKNFRLRIDGATIATVQDLTSNGYAQFVFSPVTLKSGTRVISVLADIIGGSSRTFQFQIRNKVDVDFTDTNYGVVLSPVDTFPVGTATANDINAGTMTIQKTSNSPSGNVTDGTSGVTLARYTATAYGEPLKIETLTVGATSSNSSVGSLRNGRVLINGVQYGSTATLSKTTNNTYTTGGTSYTLNYTVQPGAPATLEVLADLFDNDGTNSLVNNDTVTAYIMNVSGALNVQKMVSLGYITVPGTSVAGNSIIDVTGSVTLNKNTTYANQTTPLPQTNYKLGSYNLIGSSSEDATINTIDVALNASSSLTSLNDVKVLVNGNIFGTIKSTVAITNGGVGATSTYSGNLSLPKSTTVAVEVWGTITTPTVPYSTDNFITRMTVTGTTVNSSASVTASRGGQTISVGTAAISAARHASSPVAAILAGNQTKTAAVFEFTTTNDQFTVQEATISVFGATTVQNIILKDGNTILATQPGSASTTFSNLSIVIPANSTKQLTVDLQLSNVGFGAGTTGENVKVTLHSYKYTALASGAQSTDSTSQPSGRNLYVYRAIPTVTNVTLPTGVLVTGVNTLAKFSISSGGTGTVAWTHMVFTYATSNLITLATPQLWDADANSQITASSSVVVDTKQIIIDTSAEEQISGAKTYVLKATVGGPVLVTGDYVTTKLAQPTTSSSPISATTATSSGAGFAASLVWSDVSAQSHSFTTYDWNTDYLVKNLPTDTQTLVK